jgi:hypothetical protein
VKAGAGASPGAGAGAGASPVVRGQHAVAPPACRGSSVSGKIRIHEPLHRYPD